MKAWVGPWRAKAEYSFERQEEEFSACLTNCALYASLSKLFLICGTLPCLIVIMIWRYPWLQLTSKQTSSEEFGGTPRAFLGAPRLRTTAICFQQTMYGVNFTNILRAAFTRADPKSAKKDSQLKQLFCDFGIYVRKSCSQNVGEIDPWCRHLLILRQHVFRYDRVQFVEGTIRLMS